MGDTPWQGDACSLVDEFRSGRRSPAEELQATLDAIDASSLNAFCFIDREQAEASARTADVSKPFGGVPIGVKELDSVLGWPDSHASVPLRHQVGGHTATQVQRMRDDGGAVLVGQTTASEFGGVNVTRTVLHGTTHNPWQHGRTPGGSSGGSAATVASGCVAVAHANDGGGSIRIPASECGLVGLKPSKGRVSLGPALGESWIGGVVEGCVSRSVRDTAAMMDVLSGYETGDPNTPPLPARPYATEVGAKVEKLRVGLLSGALLPGGLDHPDARASVEATGKLLQSLGHHVEVAHPAALNEAEFGDVFLAIVIAHIANDVAALEKAFGVTLTTDDIEPGNHLLAQFGNATTAVAYLSAVSWVHAWTRRVVSWWLPRDGKQGFDVLVTPTLAGPPPKIGALSGDDSTDRIREIMQYTAQFNMTGQPAISLPLHTSASGLPMGVQFVGAPYREDLLIRLAAQIEAAAPWSSRRPAVHA